MFVFRYGTAKVNEGLKRKSSIKIVTPDWLWCCAERWEKVEELIFPLNKSVPVTLKPPAHCSSPEIAFAERCPDNLKLLPEATNPKYTISNEDLAEMDKEVDDMLTSESSSDSDPEPEADPKDENESSEDSLTGAMPRGQKRKMSKNDDIDEDNDDGPADRFRRGNFFNFFFFNFFSIFFFQIFILFQVKMFPVTLKSLRKVMMKMMFVLIHLNEMMMTMSPQVKIVMMRVMMTG